MNFPDDDNGDALRRLQEEGDDLSVSRDVDFTVVFPDSSSAEGFAAHFRNLGLRVSVEFAETDGELPWDVVVAKHMSLSHQSVTDFEDTLQNVAQSFGGRNDGWGSFSQVPTIN